MFSLFLILCSFEIVHINEFISTYDSYDIKNIYYLKIEIC